MAGSAIKGEIHRFSMATETADTDTAIAIKIHTVTESAGVLNIAGLVMECNIRPCPVLRVRVVKSMAGFTAGAPGTGDADIESRISAGTAGLTMAGLTGRQVSSGVGTVSTSIQVSSVNRMRNRDSRPKILQVHR